MGGSTDGDGLLRLRLWVAGFLMDESWVDAAAPDAHRRVETIRALHERLATEAERCGYEWMAEVYNPAMSDERAYLRFGTDTAGMIAPYPGVPGPDTWEWLGWDR